MHQDDWHAEACDLVDEVIAMEEALAKPRPEVPYVAPRGGRMEPVIKMSDNGDDLSRLEALRLQTLATRGVGGLFAAVALSQGDAEAVVMAAIASPITTALIYRIIKRGR